MTTEHVQLAGLVLVAAAVLAALLLLALLAALRRRSALARPLWPRMLEETAYFQRALMRIFQAQGYRVLRYWIVPDRIERQEREVVFALADSHGQRCAALCGRWVIPITSEVISRFEQALATTGAETGMIVTTSYFTTAALERAAGLPVALHDGQAVQRWLHQVWP